MMIWGCPHFRKPPYSSTMEHMSEVSNIPASLPWMATSFPASFAPWGRSMMCLGSKLLDRLRSRNNFRFSFYTGVTDLDVENPWSPKETNGFSASMLVYRRMALFWIHDVFWSFSFLVAPTSTWLDGFGMDLDGQRRGATFFLDFHYPFPVNNSTTY